MKKDELKASLGKIRPREELIESTLEKIESARERKESRRQFVLPYPQAIKLAGALCSLVLVFFFGFAVARGNGITAPSTENSPRSTVAEIDTICVSNPDINVTSFILNDEDESEWLIVECAVTELGFIDRTDADIADGIANRCRIKLSAESVQGRSQNFSLETIQSEITAEICFYDADTLHDFVDLMSDKMLVRIEKNANDGWLATDFSVAE